MPGAAVALFCAMHTQERLGGCVALSTMLPEKDFPDLNLMVNKGQSEVVIKTFINSSSPDIPYFQAHGESDTLLPLAHGIRTSKILKQFLPNHQVKKWK